MQEPFPARQYDVRVPEYGGGDAAITLVNWLVEPGQNLIAGERIAELLVDSCLIQLESEVNGELTQIQVPSSAKVETGQVIASIKHDSND